MWEYLAVLFLGFWLGIAIFLYVSCYWVEEILDLPAVRDGARADADQPSASGAHARLKRLVRRVVEEAMALPALAHYAHRHEPADDSAAGAFDARTYEDLLATAILNKVIERYQTETTGGRSGGASSGIHSASASPTPSAPSSSSTTSPPRSPHTPPPLHDDDAEDSDSEWEHHVVGRQEDMPELPRRVPFPEFGGDIIHCTESLGEELLEEMPGSDLQAVDGSWEENWLFQKKKVKSLQSVPVPMLVPNSNTEYKAMIGDRDADDTTDLSDAGTDTEDENEYKSDIGKALQSKTVIGGKTPVDQLLIIEAVDETIHNTTAHSAINNIINRDAEYDSIGSENLSKNEMDNTTEIQEVTADFNSSNSEVMVVDIDSGPLTKAEFSVGEIHRTNGSPLGVDDTDGVDSTIDTSVINKVNANSLSNHQRDGEYEETMAKPVQRYADSLRRQHYPHENNVQPNENSENREDELIPGSIADRERKKWLNYVEMPNNPYSTEAIQKRLSNKSTSAVFDFLTTKASSEVNTENEFNREKLNSQENPTSPSPKILKDILAEEVPQYKRYGRDYYINEAKRSAGARKTSNLSGASSLSSINRATSLDQFDTNEFTSPVLLIKQFNLMAVAKDSETKQVKNNKPIENSITTNNRRNNEKNMVSIEYEDDNQQSLFSAKPVYIEDDTDEKFEDILKSSIQSIEQDVIKDDCNFGNIPVAINNGIDESLLSSSSLEDSIKIYNVPKGEIVKNPRDVLDATTCDSLTGLDKNDNVVASDKIIEKGANTASRKNDTVALDPPSSDKMMNGADSIKSIENFEIQLPKVKDLAKKFVKTDNNEEFQPPKFTPRRRKFSNDYELEVVNKNDQKLTAKQLGYMHSLTARSISKEFREELKLSMATPIKIPGGSNEFPEGIDDITRETSSPGSPVPQPGTLKNKLAFFESLKSLY